MSKATPGPWRWRVSKKGHSVQLVADDGMGSFVMGFDRWGTGSAAPCFRVNGIMECARVLAVEIPGQEHNASWNMTLAHPDAHLIAMAPELLNALEMMVMIAGVDDDAFVAAVWDLAKEVRRKARREPPLTPGASTTKLAAVADAALVLATEKKRGTT